MGRFLVGVVVLDERVLLGCPSPRRELELRPRVRRRRGSGTTPARRRCLPPGRPEPGARRVAAFVRRRAETARRLGEAFVPPPLRLALANRSATTPASVVVAGRL